MKTGKKKQPFRVILAAFLVVFVFLALLLSPLFNVTQVTASGYVTRSKAALLYTAGLDKPVNIFAVSARRIRNNLLADPYIASVQIEKDYLARSVDITIRERTLRGYVEFLPGTYLYIDETGTVLEVATSFTQKLPVVVGLELSSFTVGQVLDVPHQQSFDTLITLTNLLYKHEMASTVVRVSLQDRDNTRIRVGALEVELGELWDADIKIRRLAHILPELEARGLYSGFLDLRDISRPARFRALT